MILTIIYGIWLISLINFKIIEIKDYKFNFSRFLGEVIEGVIEKTISNI